MIWLIDLKLLHYYTFEKGFIAQIFASVHVSYSSQVIPHCFCSYSIQTIIFIIL